MEQTGCDLILFGQKTPQSLIQQGLEGSTVVGKDEVGSSNLPSSSRGRKWFRRGSWRPDKRAEAPCFVKNGKNLNLTGKSDFALAA